MDDNRLRVLGIELLQQALHDNPHARLTALDVEEQLFETLTESQYTAEIVRIALHLSQVTFTGYYSLIFNEKFPEIYQLKPQGFFPEVYHNPLLSLEERSDLADRHQLEYESLMDAFRGAVRKGLTNPEFFRNPLDAEIEDRMMIDLYSQSFNRLCLEDRLENEADLQKLNQHTQSCPVTKKVYCLPLAGGIPMEHCLPTHTLLIALLKDRLDPLTRELLPERLIQEFQTELKLVEYAVSVLPVVESKLSRVAVACVCGDSTPSSERVVTESSTGESGPYTQHDLLSLRSGLGREERH